MKKRRKRTIRPVFKFILFLLFIFMAAYFLSGNSSSDSQEDKSKKVNGYVANDTKTSISDQFNSDGEASTWERIGRIAFIQQAVDNKRRSSNYVALDDIPVNVRQAIVAVEDSRYFSHHGFDVEGIMRASLVNLQKGEIEEGASTITQQLVKNLFLNGERTFSRKIEELLLALDMEANYSKDEILELYLNTIYFGSGYYGIRDAAEGYFGKEPDNLNLAEASMIAGLPNAPSLYSPYVDFLMAKKRQFIVLDAMVNSGYITKAQSDDAKIKPLYLAH